MVKRFAPLTLLITAGLMGWRAVPVWGTALVPPIVMETFQAAEQLESARRFPEAYQIYRRLMRHGDLPPLVEAMVWYRLGRAQQKNHEPKNAIMSLSKAVRLDPENEDYRVTLAELRGERYQRKGEGPSIFYGSWRNAGTARQLTNTNGVLHIFVRGRNSQPWNRRERMVTAAQVAEASQWLKRKSADYRVQETPRFEHRYLILTDQVYWSSMDIPDNTTTAREREEWVRGIPARFGATSLDDLFSQAFEGKWFDNKAIVFHSVKEGRAFAIPSVCNSSTGGDWEEAFVHIRDDEIETPDNARVYTHELLHLYGADDLYNKVQDPANPVRDIMNCKASSLDHSVIGALTAYAIGWRSQPPSLTQLRIEDPMRQ